jgi:hypothetical protein
MRQVAEAAAFAGALLLLGVVLAFSLLFLAGVFGLI